MDHIRYVNSIRFQSFAEGIENNNAIYDLLYAYSSVIFTTINFDLVFAAIRQHSLLKRCLGWFRAPQLGSLTETAPANLLISASLVFFSCHRPAVNNSFREQYTAMQAFSEHLTQPP